MTRIDLSPADRFWVTWRRPPALPRPESVPFDLDDCLHRLRRISVRIYGYQWDWSKAQLSPGMSREEAAFWLCAMSAARETIKPAELADRLAARPPTTAPSVGEVGKRFHGVKTHPAPLIMLVLSRLLTLDDFVELLLGGLMSNQIEMLLSLREFFTPYLTEAEIERVRGRVTPLLDPAAWPQDHYAPPPMAWHLAAMVGPREPLRALVASWPNDFYAGTDWDHSWYHQPQLIVLGLDDPRLIESEMRRLKLPVNLPVRLRGWLATTGLSGLDHACGCVLDVTNREECEKLVQILGWVKAPQNARCMLELKLSSRAPRPARQWLEENMACAVEGLLDTASGRGRLADAAIEYLRLAKRVGHDIRALDGRHERVRREVIDWEPPSHAPFDPGSTPGWLGAKPPKGAKKPAWIDVQSLPPLVVGDRCLAHEQVATVLLTLGTATFDAPPPLLRDLKEHATVESRDAFAWTLLEGWLDEGAPRSDRWALAASGFLGGDELALKLTPLIRRWPGESQHQRAVFALECLRAIGTDTALMCLNGMARKLEFKALKAKAMECMEGIAAQRGMTRAELEDRIVPDCDLDPRGGRVFDFGPRQFHFVFGPQLKPMVRDAAGRVKSDLPAPGVRDDADRAKVCVAAWKLMKKQIKEVARTQADRLEQAMVSGRRWPLADFKALLVGHPLMIHLARLLLWGTYGANGSLGTVFRITEDSRFADEHDGDLRLDDGAAVGLVHPLQLSEEQKRAWGQIFSDYEILAPFPQLGRPLYGLQDGEAEQTGLNRHAGIKIPAAALVGTLERLGWTRGVPEDGGFFHEHSKPFYAAGVTAVVVYQGVPTGYLQDGEAQTIEQCFFVPGVQMPKAYPSRKDALQLGKVDPVVVSDVLMDLAIIAGPAV